MQKTESKDKAGALKIVSFRVDDNVYAVEISKIIEIIYYRPTQAMPQSPDFVEGVVDLRGIVIPVLDLKKRLGLSSKNAGTPNHILIIRFGDKRVGIIVDEVQSVIQIEEAQIQSPQKFIKGGGSKHLRGVSKVDDRLIFILSLDKLLSDDEQAQLQEIKE
jgi:purine-binding chemotaxis protein CheW